MQTNEGKIKKIKQIEIPERVRVPPLYWGVYDLINAVNALIERVERLEALADLEAERFDDELWDRVIKLGEAMREAGEAMSQGD